MCILVSDSIYVIDGSREKLRPQSSVAENRLTRKTRTLRQLQMLFFHRGIPPPELSTNFDRFVRQAVFPDGALYLACHLFIIEPILCCVDGGLFPERISSVIQSKKEFSI